MPFDSRSADWLEQIHELNRLFLIYLRSRADAGRPCLGLPRGAARRLAEASSDALDRIAALPTALFELDLGPPTGTRDQTVSMRVCEPMQIALALTILSSAWHLARSRPFEARLYLHLSARQLRQLRTMPVSALPELARAENVLVCAFADRRLTWPALMREEPEDFSRNLVLIALQPDLGLAGEAWIDRRKETDRRSVG